MLNFKVMRAFFNLYFEIGTEKKPIQNYVVASGGVKSFLTGITIYLR
jgi:hypothetical protein